jgi:hypothetical protein
MTSCESIRERAAGLAALPPDHPERAAAWEHARTCAACRRLVHESEKLQVLLADARPAPLPSPVMARVSRLVLDLRAGDRRRVVWSTVAACAAALLLVVLGQERSAAARDWILAAALCCAAAGLVVLTRRLSLPVAAGAVVAGAVAAGISGQAGPIEAALGMHCVALESAAACAAVGAGWLAARRGLSSIGLGFIVATAAAGALAGDAALHLTCRARDSLPHLMVFHLGGIILAAMLAGLAWRVAARA